jgi:aminopeptidase N
MTRIILDQVKNLQKGLAIDFNTDLFTIFIDAYKNLLLDEQLDNALKALALTLPDQGFLMDQLDIADVDNIFHARKQLQAEISKQLSNDLFKVYTHCQLTCDYQFNAIDAGKRSLGKACLSLLMGAQQNQFFKLCYEDYLKSNNMTDSMGALSLLSQYTNPYREKALKDFESKWKHEPLVMDKWFSIQAMSNDKNCLQQLKLLMKHDMFELKNPNRVRSLISVFASLNFINFHNIDGSGYTFIADMVIQLDNLNPQVASRLVKSFSRWKRYSSTRQSLMKEQLQRILKQPNLSGDVYEIVSTSL